jgi:hypothetical protein
MTFPNHNGWRKFTKKQWKSAYRVARMGNVKHNPVPMLLKHWAIQLIT